MKGNHVIANVRFLEYGKQAPKGSRFKGSLDSQSLVGWYDYTSRKEAADKQKINTLHKGGLLGYTSHNNEIRTYTSEGWLDEKKSKAFKQQVAKSFSKKGNLCWDTVISLRNYMDSSAAGMRDVNDCAAIVSKLLPSYFTSIGLDNNNMIWWMNYHTNKKNPHMHIVFMEKNQTRTRGMIPQKAINKYKSMFLKELGMREHFEKEFGITPKSFMQEKDEIRNAMIELIEKKELTNKDISKLHSMLPKTGRLSYNSANMIPFRELLDNITDKLLQSEEVKESYEKWLHKVEVLDNFQNVLAGDKISNFKETELQKLHVRIGNIILKQAKTDTTKKIEYSNLWFTESYILHSDNDFYTIKLPHKLYSMQVDKDKVYKSDDGLMRINLDNDEKCVSISKYLKHIDVWKSQKPLFSKKVTGKELIAILDGKEFQEEEASMDTNKIDPISDLDKTIHGEDKVENSKKEQLSQRTMNINEDPTLKDNVKGDAGFFAFNGRDFGIKSKVSYRHHSHSIQEIKKGARRLLSNDEREKERDLDKFIREFEEEQIRTEM